MQETQPPRTEGERRVIFGFTVAIFAALLALVVGVVALTLVALARLVFGF
jgi:hypothetical protein